MALSLTDAQLDQISNTLLICKDPATTKLPKPTNSTGDQSLGAKLDPIGADPVFGIPAAGVVDFTNVLAPKVWLHKAEELWRIASTAKLALILAAVQLRDDVRWLFAQGFIKNGKDGDDLFAMSALWRRSKNPMTALLAKSKRPPRISTIFDFSSGVPEFIGPLMTDPINHQDVVNRLVQDTKKVPNRAHLQWKSAPTYDFTERLWLAGARSDNVAATTCISEIGIAYLKAVQVAYGLFDLPNGVCMFLAGGYTAVDTTAAVDSDKPKVKYRSIEKSETVLVTDALRVKGQSYTDRASTEAGNVLGLTMFMIAWRQGKFISPVVCNFITSCLADTTPLTTGSGLTLELPTNEVLGLATKIGLLDTLDGEPAFLNADFAYVETQPSPGALFKYGVVAAGIRPDNPHTTGAIVAGSLGLVIYHALTF